MDHEEVAVKVRGQFAMLEQIAKEEIPKEDYRQQADRWNRYHAVLDTIEGRVNAVDPTTKSPLMPGVWLRKNVESNIQEVSEDNLGIWGGLAIGAGMVTLLSCFVVGILWVMNIEATQDNVELIIGYEPWYWWIPGGFGIMLVLSFLKYCSTTIMETSEKKLDKQQMIKASCKPVLHINELEYAHKIIAGLPRIQKDPEVKLPELSIEVPRQWLAQESLLAVMNSLSDISLPEQLEK
jgi:hypothetical protein